MPSEVILPRVDMDMSTGKISKWLVDDGAPVKKGQPLFEIETDKAAMEIEAEASGTVRTLAQAGADDVAVGSVVALIYREGESEAQASAAPAAAPAAASPAPEAQAAPTEDLLRDGQTDAAPPPASGAATAGPAAVSPEASNGLARDMQGMNGANGADRGRATPLARRLARERGHELSALNGTGPRGRVQASDVPGAVAAAAATSASVTPPVAAPESIAVLRDGPTDVPPAVATPPAARPAPAPAPAARAPASPTAPMPAPAAAPAATPALASRSAAGALATFRDGTGAPIVLLHGFGADRDGWRPFLQGYGGGRPVLALDLPGHGGAALAGAGDFEALVDGVEAALIEASMGAFTLVGHSLGGAVAAAVAARGAVDLAALVLIAPAGLGPEINGGFVQGYLAATSEASLAPWLRELVADPSLVTPAFVRLSLRARDPVIASQRRIAEAVFPDGTQGFSIRADLARIACPVRVIFGTADRIVPARHAEGLPALVALHRLPGVGHLPQIEARETVQAIVAQAARG